MSSWENAPEWVKERIAAHRTGDGVGTHLAAKSDLDKLQLLEVKLDQPAPFCYGLHYVAGAPIVQHTESDGQTKLLNAQGDGEWDALVICWVNGKSINVADTSLVHFHPGLDGEIGTESDPSARNQQLCSFLPAEIANKTTFSRTAYTALRLPPDPTAPSAQFDIRGIYRTRRVRIFDAAGNQTDYKYSTNTAWQLLDAFIALHLLPDGTVNQALTPGEKAHVNFVAFAQAAADCDVDIGGGIKRFESNVAFVEKHNLAEMFETFEALCRGYVREQDGKLALYVDKARASIYTFAADQIRAWSLATSAQDLRGQVNRLVVKIRDTESGGADHSKDFAPWTKTLDAQTHQDQVGRIIKKEVDFGANTCERAERVGWYWLNRALLENQCRLFSTLDAGKLLPGDHVVGPRDHSYSATREFEILEATDEPDGNREFFLQEYDANLFSDSAEAQQAVESPNVITDRFESGALLPVEWFGAVGGGKASFDGELTASSDILTCDSGPFKAEDVGKRIWVEGAITGGSDLYQLYTTIAAYITSTQVQLTAASEETVAHAEVYWGWTDDAAAIQAAINACTREHPGIRFRGGVYGRSAALTYNEYVRHIHGVGIDSSILLADTPAITASALHFVDPEDLILERLTFRGPGINAVGGGKLNFTRLNNSNIPGLILRQVSLRGIADSAIFVNTPITSVFSQVLMKYFAGNGLHLYAGGTSVKVANCYAITGTKSGFYLDGMAYCGLEECAAEVVGIGYEIINSFNITAKSCGAESQVNRSTGWPGHGWKIDGGEEIMLLGCYSRDLPQVSNRHVLVTGSAKRVIVDHFRRLNDPVTPTYAIEIEAGCENVTIHNPNFPQAELLNNGTRCGFQTGFGPKEQAIGVTSDPSTTSTTPVLLTDMQKVVITTGNKVLLSFSCSCKNSDPSADNFFEIWRDGARISTVAKIPSPIANQVVSTGLVWTDWPGAGEHTYEVRWYVNAGTGVCDGTNRALQVGEVAF